MTITRSGLLHVAAAHTLALLAACHGLSRSPAPNGYTVGGTVSGLANGQSIVLDNQPGADTQGYSGLQDGVNNHWGALFEAALLSTFLSVGAEAGNSNQENNLIQAIRSGASDSFNQAGQQVVERELNIQPTLTIRPGFPVRVIVDRDLVLAPYSE